jgi:folylpolyglutamate synthase/dihydropteroate synthase
LKQHGLKTGFYSSPHLIEVRERIRINGKPLPKDKFAKYFWQVYSMLKQDKVLQIYFIHQSNNNSLNFIYWLFYIKIYIALG